MLKHEEAPHFNRLSCFVWTQVSQPLSAKKINYTLDESSAVEASFLLKWPTSLHISWNWSALQELALLDYLETELTFPEFQLLLCPTQKSPCNCSNVVFCVTRVESGLSKHTQCDNFVYVDHLVPKTWA